MTDIVHIKVEGIEDELILSAMQVLNQTFYENSVMNQSATPELVFKFTENQSGNQLLVTGELNGVTQTVNKKMISGQETKIRKYAYLAVYLLLLQQQTGRVQPWGLLNGMRPTKLIHGMKKRGYRDDEIRAYMQDEYLVSDEKMDLLLEVANKR